MYAFFNLQSSRVVCSKPANFMLLLAVARPVINVYGVWCNETSVPISGGFV